jgi:hypothetical protein
MRKREGIEPRYGKRSVGADLVSNREGDLKGPNGQGPGEPTGVKDRGTSPGQRRELGRSAVLLPQGGRGAQPANWEETQGRGGSRVPS